MCVVVVVVVVVYVCMHVHVYLFFCVYVYMCACISVSVCVCVCVCVFVKVVCGDLTPATDLKLLGVILYKPMMNLRSWVNSVYNRVCGARFFRGGCPWL